MKKTKRTLALVLSFVMAVSGVELPSFATKQNDAEVVLGQQENKQCVTDVFGDISDTVWYLDAVQFVYDKGLMTGSEGMFWPEKSVSRAMLVTTLYRMEGSPVVENDSAMERFEDVKADKWYTDAICWAYENEITTGNPNMDTFGVDTPVTREQLTTFFYRFAQYKELDTAQIGDLSTLLNVDQMETYAEESVVWAVGTGLINGTRSTDENGEFVYDLAPKADTTRAQLAVILQRFCEEYALFAEEELPEVTPEVTEEATPEETPEVTEEALPEATPEVTEEEAPEVTPEEEDEIIADLGGVTNEAAMAFSKSPRYFPVTMYNYDRDGMNAITRQMEVERHLSNIEELDKWRGLYFVDGDESASFDYSAYINQIISYEKVTTGTVEPGASYVLVSNFVDTSNDSVHTYGVSVYNNNGRFKPTSDIIDLSKPTLTRDEIQEAIVWQCDTGGYLYYENNGQKQYIDIRCGANTCGEEREHDVGVTGSRNNSAILDTDGSGVFWLEDTCGTKTYYFNIVGNTSGTNVFGGYEGNDLGSKFSLYKEVKTANLEDPRMHLFESYVKVNDTTLTPNESYILVNDYYTDRGYTVGAASTDTQGRLTSGQEVGGDTIHEQNLNPNTLIWKYDADGYLYFEQDEDRYYIDIICNNTNNANVDHISEHMARFIDTKQGAAKIEAKGDGVFAIFDTPACGATCYLDMLDKNSHLLGGWISYSNGGRFSLYKAEMVAQTGVLDVADYNKWLHIASWEPAELDSPMGGKLSGSVGAEPNSAGNYGIKGNRFYGGLVADTLDAYGNIQFNVLEPGLFTLDEHEYKKVYTNVELPFEYDYETGDYVFDSSTMGARFDKGLATDNATMKYSTEAQKVTPAYADGSTTKWLPFNDKDEFVSDETSQDHHYAMVFNIPFFMTADGLLPSGQRYPLEFEFSGDDDVWVFIDGQLVLDMGGIHNNISGKLNFADNQWSVYVDGSLNRFGEQQASYVNGAATSGNIFATLPEAGDGILPMTREAFAEKSVHTLTMFYMERGAGSCNNKIKFNLLVRDSLNIMKEIDNSNLSDEMLEYVNQRDFKFELKNNNEPVANRNYYLMDIRGMYLQTLQTDKKGQFTLKNGQTAKFVGPLQGAKNGYEGDHFVVTELEDEDTTAWVSPDWYYMSRLGDPSITTGDPIYVEKFGDRQRKWQSPEVEVAEAAETYMETINIRCTNTLNLQGRPELNDDRVVIDYGLPVEVDIFANDIVPTNVEIDYENVMLSVNDIKFGNVEYDSETHKVRYALKQQMTTVEKITYTVPYRSLDGEEATETAILWIMPATTMYYEEDFGEDSGENSGLIKYTGDWDPIGEDENFLQEPGVVGDFSDSTYGSDMAYMDDVADSNGTSKFVQTTETTGAGFSYTFTGKGTTFFARTTSNSGFMKIKIECVNSGETTTYVDEWRRDTRFTPKEENDENPVELYNVPVFSWTTEEYGTYKVTVSLSKLIRNPNSGELLYGTDFWLDGIRVLEPLDLSSVNADIALSAYAADGEAYIDVVTLRDKILHNKMVFNLETQKYEWPMADQLNNRFVVFTDSTGEIKTAEEYISKGPKEEVYLKKGQSISFELVEWDSNGAKVFLGMKAPMGAGTVLINGNEVTVQNTVDGYYEISEYQEIAQVNGKNAAKFVIEANGDNLISLTNIKATGGTRYAIISDLAGTGNDSSTDSSGVVKNVDIYITGYEGSDPLP